MTDVDLGNGSPAENPPTFAIPVDGILEAALYAPDLDAAEHFYGRLLGLRPLQRNGNRHVFYAVGRTVLLIFNPAATELPLTKPGLPVPTHGARGPGHVCFSVPLGRMAEVAARLQAAGITVEADFVWPGGARSIYVRDPAGNSVEWAEPGLWGLA